MLNLRVIISIRQEFQKFPIPRCLMADEENPGVASSLPPRNPPPDRGWWEAQQRFVLHSDQLAAGIGVDALKTVIFVNAGAIVAVIAFAGQMWGKPGGNIVVHGIIGASTPFLLGVIAGVLAFVLAYLYQSALTFLAVRALDWNHQVQGPRWAKIAQICLHISMVALTFVSLSAFVWGAIRVQNAFLGA